MPISEEIQCVHNMYIIKENDFGYFKSGRFCVSSCREVLASSRIFPKIDGEEITLPDSRQFFYGSSKIHLLSGLIVISWKNFFPTQNLSVMKPGF